VDLPIENGDFPVRYDSLPEAMMNEYEPYASKKQEEQLGMFANHDIVASPSNDLRREYDITARPVRYGFQPSQ